MATKRKDGRLQSSVYVTDYFTGERKRIFVYGYTEKEVEAEKRRVLESAEKTMLYNRISPTFADYALEVFKQKLSNKAINDVTYESYVNNIRNHALPRLPKDIKLSEVATHHIKFVLEGIAKPRTKSYTYTVMNIVFEEAKFEHLIATNPCSYVRKPQYESKHAEVIEPDSYKAIMEAVAGTQWEYLFHFAINTGCRRGEICALRWIDFDAENKTIKVTSSIKKTKAKGQYRDTTKSDYSVRTLRLTDEVVASLIKWKRKLRLMLMENALPFSEKDFIFRSVTNLTKPMPLDSVTNKMKRLKKQLGLPDRTCMHSYRRTLATNLATADINPKKIQHTLGHATAAFSLDVYVKNSSEMSKGVAEATDAMAQKYAGK